MKKWIGVGASVCGLAVLAGAFGAHALKARLSVESLAIFELAARYQFLHGQAIILVALVGSQFQMKVQSCLRLFLLGVVVFSGSLYILAWTQVKLWGAVTPIGGVSLLIAWSLFAYKCVKK